MTTVSRGRTKTIAEKALKSEPRFQGASGICAWDEIPLRKPTQCPLAADAGVENCWIACARQVAIDRPKANSVVAAGCAEDKSAADLFDVPRLFNRAQAQLQQWLVSCDADVVPAYQTDLIAYANYPRNPALSVPMPAADGELPPGPHLIGYIGDELRSIAMSEAFRDATRWSAQLPTACRPWCLP